MKSNTQNAKIEAITEKTLVLGIDVGSETHYARAFDYRGIEYLKKPFKFSNTEAGFVTFKKYYDVYNYSSRYNCSKEEAIKHCLELKQKLGTDVIEFDGVKYADLHECCRMLKFPYRRVVAKIMNSDCSVQETLQNLKQKKERLFGTGDIENITLENGKCYKNIKELCSDLRIREGTLYGYALRK